ncbi:MAG: bifunctional pyr operon transcriptional regulator/uracil phosphoribosyltransferase PyrR [Dehalococcoidia bacterium]|nr:bifunctional pyr operon transcriptional regulator/uracil phosphoribosyltransferase PyrR [Dehalococcoidia bacterium]MCA9845291.1 bifunctional pyr operon transcriptional regulator/uracil phosphoribosyltransferase PyrR [Dehalococcoidia bacterium]
MVLSARTCAPVPERPPVSDQVMNAEQLSRTIRRLAHEIVENNRGTQDLVLAGLLTRGVPLAQRLAAEIEAFEGTPVPVGSLDVALFRDDLRSRDTLPHVRPSELPQDIEGCTVVLVDDVLYTGRTIRAALDAIFEFGRPARIRLAVMVDRGHRELPIRPDFVGRNIPTSLGQEVSVRLKEQDGEDGVYLEERGVAVG